MSYKPLIGVPGGLGAVAINDADETAVDTANARVDFGPGATPWGAVGNVVTPAPHATVTLLPNGQVLKAGGHPGGGNTTDAELYNPATGVWTATGALNGARQYALGILLFSGKVLVIGGWDDANNGIATCELYDPVAGTFALTGALGTGCALYTATLLPSGNVLVTGGQTGGGLGTAIATCQLYDAVAGTWSGVAALPEARSRHSAILLPNGKVLVAGGWNVNPPFYLPQSILYDPNTNIWGSGANIITVRENQSLVLLPNGRSLMCAGSAPPALIQASEVYDYSTNSWTSVAPMGVAHELPSVLLLPSGKVLVIDGTDAAATAITSCEMYDYQSNTWTAVGANAIARYAAVAILLPSGQVLLPGGNGNAPTPRPPETELFSTPTPALTTASGVASVTALGTGFYRLTLTASALALWQTGGRHVYAEPASYAQPYDRSAQIQEAQVVRTDTAAGTIDVFVATNPVGINAAALPFNFWIR